MPRIQIVISHAYIKIQHQQFNMRISLSCVCLFSFFCDFEQICGCSSFTCIFMREMTRCNCICVVHGLFSCVCVGGCVYVTANVRAFCVYFSKRNIWKSMSQINMENCKCIDSIIVDNKGIVEMLRLARSCVHSFICWIMGFHCSNTFRFFFPLNFCVVLFSMYFKQCNL